MSPQLVRLLTILLLVLIHLFFFRVIRAVWVGVRPLRENLPKRNRFVRNDRPCRQRPRKGPSPRTWHPDCSLEHGLDQLRLPKRAATGVSVRRSRHHLKNS